MSNAAGAQIRLAYRVAEVAQLTGASVRQIHALMDQGELHFKRVGRSIFLDPANVHRVFGFGPAERGAGREQVPALSDVPSAVVDLYFGGE